MYIFMKNAFETMYIIKIKEKMRVVSIEGRENALGLPNSETYSLMSLNFFFKVFVHC